MFLVRSNIGRLKMSQLLPEIHKGLQSNKEYSEEVQFLSFAKEYIGLLATVAAIPLLSSLFEIISPPASQANEKLAALSSFMCIIVFVLCFLLRSFLRVSKRRYIWITVGSMALSIVCIAFYLEFASVSLFLPSSRLSLSFLELILYLSIYPLLTFSLGIVLVKVFTQRKSKAIQTIVDGHLMESTDEIIAIIEDYIKMEEINQKNALLKELSNEILKPSRKHLRDLSRGSLEINRNTLIQVSNSLEEYAVSFDAVSDRDLDFWVNVGEDQIARDYFELNVNMVKRPDTRVTRIFVLSKTDLKRKEELMQVLQRHQSAHIGWAVVLYETIEYLNFSDMGVPLDFSFISTQEDVESSQRNTVLTYFRDYRNSSRRFRVVFEIPDNHQEFERQRNNYRKILSYCWVANQVFKQVFDDEMLFPNDTKARLTDQIRQSTQHTYSRFKGASSSHWNLDNQQMFMYEVSDLDDVKEAVEHMVQLSKLHENWYTIVPVNPIGSSDLEAPPAIKVNGK